MIVNNKGCLLLLRMKYHFSATTRITSMSLGNQKGYFADLINAPNN